MNASSITADKHINSIFPQEIHFAADQNWVEFFVTNRSRFPVNFKIVPLLLEHFHADPDSGCLDPGESGQIRITRISKDAYARRDFKYRGNVSMTARSYVTLWEEKEIPPIDRTDVKQWRPHVELEEGELIKSKSKISRSKTDTDIVSISPQGLITASEKDCVEFTVQNHSQYPVVFKLRGASPVEEFRAKPAAGWIEPGKSEIVRVRRIRDPSAKVPSCERIVQLSLLAKEVTEEDESYWDIWDSPDQICRKIVKCKFTQHEDCSSVNIRKLQYLKQAFVRIKNWLRALNAILLGLVFVSLLLLLVGAIVCYKILLFVHLQEWPPPQEVTSLPESQGFSWFCKGE